MGLLSWLRSHRSGEDTGRAPAAAGTDSSAERGGGSTEPAPVPAWRTLPQIQRTTTPPALLTDPAGFRAGLHDQRGTSVTGQLGHLVSPQAPAGLAHGLITAPTGPTSTMDGEHQSVQRFDYSARNPAHHPPVTATATPAVALQRIERAPLTHAAPVDIGAHRLPTVEPAEPADPRPPAGSSDAPPNVSAPAGTAAAAPSDRPADSGELDAPRTVELPTVAPESAEPPTVQTTLSAAPPAASPQTGSAGRPPRQGLGEPLTELPPTVTTVQRGLASGAAGPRPEPPPPGRPAQPTHSAPAPPTPETDELTVVPLSFQPARVTQPDLPVEPFGPALPTATEPPANVVEPAAAEPTASASPVGDLPVQRQEFAANPSPPEPRAVPQPPAALVPADAATDDAPSAPAPVAGPPTAPLLGETALAPSPPASDPLPLSGSAHAGGPDPADLGAPIQRATVDRPTPNVEPTPVVAPVVVPLLAQRVVDLLAAPAPSGTSSAPAATPSSALAPTVPDVSPEPPVARLRWESPADVDGSTPEPAADLPPHAVPDSPVLPSSTVQRSVARPSGAGGATARIPAGGSPAVLQRTTTTPAVTAFGGVSGPHSRPGASSTARPATPTGLVDAGTVAVAAGIAQRMADGSVVFTPPGTVQRAPDDSAVPSTEPAPAEPPPEAPQDTSSPPAGETPAPGGTDPAHPAGTGGTPKVTDELVRALFGPLSRLLKAELRLERERAGHLIDTRH